MEVRNSKVIRAKYINKNLIVDSKINLRLLFRNNGI
ncbi:unnamed protein product [Tenebrio molitor]|jgi:hypothetical protein|nr:unnamed protein product [Tenebrio molitor]